MNRKNFAFLLSLYIMTVCTSAQEKGTFTDIRDGHLYTLIKIGEQTWMAENLSYLPCVNRVSESQFDGKCYYVYGYDGNDLTKATEEMSFRKYGVLYNFDAAKESCPDGWHLPSDDEWKELEMFLGMENEADVREWRPEGEVGKKLKSTTEWKDNNGTNEVGFNALPAGCRGYNGFESLGYCAYFWTASPAGGDNGWRRGLCIDEDGTCREEDRRYFGASVRCVMD